MAAVAQLSSQSGEKGSRFDPFACRRAAEKPYELPASASATSSGASAASGAEPSASHESLAALLTGERPDASWVGIGLAITSLMLMPALGRAKERIGERMGSVATKGEGQQNMLCAYLSAALLVGVAGNAVLGLWWLDPTAGLLIAAVSIKEGVETWRGEGCCVPAGGDEGSGCGDDCCS